MTELLLKKILVILTNRKFLEQKFGFLGFFLKVLPIQSEGPFFRRPQHRQCDNDLQLGVGNDQRLTFAEGGSLSSLRSPLQAQTGKYLSWT